MKKYLKAQQINENKILKMFIWYKRKQGVENRQKGKKNRENRKKTNNKMEF